MPFSAFLGNRRVIERLRNKLREDRFPHALIFAGPEGVGKRTCALMIARALNCIEAAMDDFCGVCSQCRKIDSGTHPDVLAIGLEEDASEIKIAQVREVLQSLELRPMEGRAKVYIIDPANLMNTAAANALLKGLEEPSEKSHFILLTNNLHELLLTVRSRSQCYHFTPLALEELRSIGGDELILRWSRGTIGGLRNIDPAALKQRRETILDFLETAARADETAFRDLLAASADLARSKNDFDSHLDMVSVLLGDLLYLREGIPERVVNVDLQERLSGLAREIEIDQFIKIAEFLRVMESGVKGYLNRQMLSDGLALTANKALARLAHDNTLKSR
jgi:DNA polymerase-3 subunit delta'